MLLALTVAAAVVLIAVLDPARGGEPWRIQWPRVPREIRLDFLRVSVAAGTFWGAAALYLSIVPSYVRELLHTDNLALLGGIAAVALACSCVAQTFAQRRRFEPRHACAVGLVLLALGLAALTVAFPVHSVAALLGASVAVSVGHGVGIVGAQHELNTLAPNERRGEITAAF